MKNYLLHIFTFAIIILHCFIFSSCVQYRTYYLSFYEKIDKGFLYSYENKTVEFDSNIYLLKYKAFYKNHKLSKFYNLKSEGFIEFSRKEILEDINVIDTLNFPLYNTKYRNINDTIINNKYIIILHKLKIF